MSLTTETINDLVKKSRFMNRTEKSFARRGTKEQKRGTSIQAVHGRKGTEQKKSIYDNNAVARPATHLRRKARRAAKGKSAASTRIGNVNLTTLRKSHNLNRREWKLVEAPVHLGVLETTIEEVRWKGKNKLGGRTSKYSDFDQL